MTIFAEKIHRLAATKFFQANASAGIFERTVTKVSSAFLKLKVKKLSSKFK